MADSHGCCWRRWTSPTNLSAICARCDAVGVLEAPCGEFCRGRSARFNQASLGSEKWVGGCTPTPRWRRGCNGCGREGFRIYGTQSGREPRWTIANAISPTTGLRARGEKGGPERGGQAQAWTSGCLLPMGGMVQSLNVSGGWRRLLLFGRHCASGQASRLLPLAGEGVAAAAA